MREDLTYLVLGMDVSSLPNRVRLTARSRDSERRSRGWRVKKNSRSRYHAPPLSVSSLFKMGCEPKQSRDRRCLAVDWKATQFQGSIYQCTRRSKVGNCKGKGQQAEHTRKIRADKLKAEASCSSSQSLSAEILGV